MKYILKLLILTFPLCAHSQSLDTIKQFNYKAHYEIILKESKKPESSYFYEKQLKKYINNETQTNIEVLALLIGYSDNKSFEPYNDIFLDVDIYNLNEEKKFDEAIVKGNTILKTKPFIIPILREVAYAYSEKGDKEKHLQYMQRTGKIYNAMLISSGSSGVNIEDAFFALGPKDGQYFLKYFAKFPLGNMGSGSNKDGYFIDMLETTINGIKTTINFNINHAINKLQKNQKK